MKQEEIIPILSQNHPTISNETSEAPPLSLDVGCSTPLSVSASHFFSVWGFLLFENSYSLIKMPLLKPLILGFKRKISGVVTQELFVLTKLKFQWAHLSIFWDRMAEMKKKISQNLVIWILFPSDEQLWLQKELVKATQQPQHPWKQEQRTVTTLDIFTVAQKVNLLLVYDSLWLNSTLNFFLRRTETTQRSYWQDVAICGYTLATPTILNPHKCTIQKSPRASGEPGDRNQISKAKNPLHPTIKNNQTNFYQTRALDWDKLL